MKNALVCPPFAALQRKLPLLAMLCMVSGCAMGGFSIDKAVPDKSTITGSVAPAKAAETDSGKASDQSAIRNVISALDFTQWGKKPVPWANPNTGSQGTITTIAETRTNAGLCRQFETSREAFDGVSLYQGETCMGDSGNWVLTSFAPM